MGRKRLMRRVKENKTVLPMTENNTAVWKQAVAVIALAGIMIIFLLTCALKWRSIGKNVYHVLRDYDSETTTVWELLEDTIDTFEGNFNNFLWGGKQLSALDANLNYLIKGEIASVQVLLGEESWLFYQTVSDGEPLVDYQGTEYFSDEKMEQIATNLTEMEAQLAAENIEFLVMVCPNKEQVMDQYMPESIVKESEESRTDRLVSYLQDCTDLEIVYPIDELQALSTEYDLYYHYDTHWNALGGYVATQQLLAALGQERSELSERIITSAPLVDHSSGDRDLARIVGMTWRFNDELEYMIDGVEFTQWDEKEFSNQNAKTQKKIMVIGDSFRIGLKPSLVCEFSEVLIVHRDEYTPELLENFSPDVVVLEYVERYSGEMAGFSLK